MPTARSTPNIALIKYWGNAHQDWRLPAAHSLSMTLNTPHVDVAVEAADMLFVRSFLADGAEKKLSDRDTSRFRKHWDLTKQYCAKIDRIDAFPENIAITIRSQIPSSIGVASSAAVFSAVAKAVSGLLPGKSLTDEQVSIIARLGSGSASRSIFGGFAQLRAKNSALKATSNPPCIDDAFAEQVAPESHWLLHDIIIIPTIDAKKVGSTEGHAGAKTSPHFLPRIEAIERRQQECIDAIKHRDFEKLQRVAEEDCLDMHHVMQTQDPPLRYLSNKTHSILEEIQDLRTEEHLEVLYTMDAGPTVHLFCTDATQPRVLAYAQQQERCTILQTKIGKGAYLLEE